ncbi:MAG: protein kinase [Lachnospiraceae bacterium]|nr:protein kinase [Lachnospiraceae bacterium]
MVMGQIKGRAIPVKEKLLERYQIKEILGENGFSILYKGYDTFRNKKVIIKELFPGKIVQRDQTAHYKVECIRLSDEAVFEVMKERVIWEAKTLIKLFPLEGIANVITFFEENQTVYTVFEYLEGITLDVYLEGKKNSKLPLNSLLNFFEPLMESLKKIHKAGCIHGKIRPDQIMVTKKNGAKLIGFCDPMKMAIDPLFVEEILPVRNSRYAPVELFMEEGKPGTATDIYGLAATIYHCITGVLPPHFYNRIQNTEVMKTPEELDVPINKKQSSALMAGLASHDFERVQTVEEFLEGFWVEEEKAKEPPKQLVLYKEPFVFIRRKKGLKVGGILAAVVLIVLIGLAPTGIRRLKEYRVNSFYEELQASSDFEKCMMLRGAGKKERKVLGNDYSILEEGEDNVIKYYDCNKKEIVVKDEMDTTQKFYRYISIDFRQEKSAVLTYYEPEGVTVWDIDLLKTDEYFNVEKTVLKDGQVVEAETLQVLP